MNFNIIFTNFSNSLYSMHTWLQKSLKIIQESRNQAEIPKDSESCRRKFKDADPSR